MKCLSPKAVELHMHAHTHPIPLKLCEIHSKQLLTVLVLVQNCSRSSMKMRYYEQALNRYDICADALYCDVFVKLTQVRVVLM